MLRKWIRAIRGDYTSVHDEDRSRQTCHYWSLDTESPGITYLSSYFPQVSKCIVTGHLNYLYKLYSHWVLKFLIDMHNVKHLDSILTFLEQYRKNLIALITMLIWWIVITTTNGHVANFFEDRCGKWLNICENYNGKYKWI